MARPEFDPGTSHATSEMGQQFTDALEQTDSEDLDFNQAFRMALAIEELEQEGAA
jgi:hypothetical protein